MSLKQSNQFWRDFDLIGSPEFNNYIEQLRKKPITNLPDSTPSAISKLIVVYKW